MRYDIRSRVKALSIFTAIVLSIWGVTVMGSTRVAEPPIELIRESGISGVPLHTYMYDTSTTTTLVTTVSSTTTTTTTTTLSIPPEARLASEAPPDCVVFSEIPDDWEYPLPSWNEDWGDMNSYPECPPDNHTPEFYRDEYEIMATYFVPTTLISDISDLVVNELAMEIITDEYTFLRFDEDVRVLQYYLGVETDGVYGPITRGEHVKALVRLGQWQPIDVSYSLNEIAGTGGYDYPMDEEKRCPEWEETFLAYGLVPVDVWSYVAWKESRCRPSIINDTLNSDGSVDYGLVQINSIHSRAVFRVCDGYSLETMLLDVDCNLRMARYLMDNTRNRLANWRIYMY